MRSLLCSASTRIAMDAAITRDRLGAADVVCEFTAPASVSWPTSVPSMRLALAWCAVQPDGMPSGWRSRRMALGAGCAARGEQLRARRPPVLRRRARAGSPPPRLGPSSTVSCTSGIMRPSWMPHRGRRSPCSTSSAADPSRAWPVTSVRAGSIPGEHEASARRTVRVDFAPACRARSARVRLRGPLGGSLAAGAPAESSPSMTCCKETKRCFRTERELPWSRHSPRAGPIDVAALSRLVEWQVQEGIDFVVACGSTGEAQTLSPEERVLVVKTVVAAADGQIPVLAGATDNDTGRAVAEARAMAALGVAGIMTRIAILQQADPGRARGALPEHRRRDRTAAAALQCSGTHLDRPQGRRPWSPSRTIRASPASRKQAATFDGCSTSDGHAVGFRGTLW